MDRPKSTFTPMDETLTPLGQEVLTALLTKKPVHAEDLAADDPVKKLSDELGGLFTEGVAFLRGIFPNPTLNKFGALLWDIVGHNVVSLAVGPNVPSLSFAAYAQKDGVMRGIIFVPPFWKKLILEDSMMQFGAVVYTGSKAVDFYNNRLEKDVIDERAALYESEFLRTLRRENPVYKFNEYQKSIIEKFPDGFASPGAARLLYESKPFFVLQA